MTRSMVLLSLAALIAVPFGPSTVAAQQATQFTPPAVGAVFTYRASVKGKTTATYIHRVLKDQAPYDGLPAYRVKNEWSEAKGEWHLLGIFVFEAKHGNVIASLNPKGETVSRARPRTGDVNWPMFVGKSWTHSYMLEENGRISKKGPVTRKVTAYEVVAVPAGNFAAFRVEGMGVEGKVTRWFAPKLGFLVKTDNRGKSGKTTIMSLTKVVVPEPKGPATIDPAQPPKSQ